MAKRKPGTYAPLSSHYFDDVAIMQAGEDAELLYVRMLAYASRQIEREGYIPEAVVMSRLGILPRVSGNGTGNEHGTDAGSRAERLVDAGLLVRVEGGYQIKSWLKWNRSANEVKAERESDRWRKSRSANDNETSGAVSGTVSGTVSEGQIQIQKQNQNQNQNSPDVDDDDAPKLKETRLPKSWAPTAEHVIKAKELGLNLTEQVEAFRSHAETHDRHAARWNAAFTTWLKKARRPATPQQPHLSAVPDAALSNIPRWKIADTPEWRAHYGLD